MEKVVPQPGPAQSLAAGLEGPDQVLLGLELQRGEGLGQKGPWEASAPGLSSHSCLSVCPGRQEHSPLGTAVLRTQVRPRGRQALQSWGGVVIGMGLAPGGAHGASVPLDWPWVQTWFRAGLTGVPGRAPCC